MPAVPSGSSDRPFSVIPDSLRSAAAAARASREAGTERKEDDGPEGPAASCCGDGAGEPELAVGCGGLSADASLDERLAYVEWMIRRESAAMRSVRAPREKSPLHGVMQDFVEGLYADDREGSIRRLDIVIAAESADLPAELLEVINLLPPGSYTRQRLCGQLNSALGARAWGHRYGTVE